MLEIMVLVLVLAVVYAVKAVSIMKSADEIAENSASFSWMKPEVPEPGAEPAWLREEQADAASVRPAVRVYSQRRPNAA